MHPSQLPQFSDATFYKYRPWDQYSKDTLVSNRIFFSSPADVNDPYDCRFPDLTKPTPDQLRKYLEIQYIHLRNPYRDKTMVRGGLVLLEAYIEAAACTKGKASWEEALTIAKELIINRSSLCSLSEIGDSPLMFAHYGDGHKGICFQFHFSLKYALAHLELVVYEKTFGKLDLFNDDDDESLVQAAIYRKSTDWEYEREWRAFRFYKPKGVVNFDPRCLSGVILGCKMSAADKIEVVSIIKSRPHPIQVYEAVMSASGIGLVVQSIADI